MFKVTRSYIKYVASSLATVAFVTCTIGNS